MIKNWYTKKPESPVKTIVLMLHGYGSNGMDLFSLVNEIEDDGVMFISVDAPFLFEGYVPGAFQWYSLVDRSTDAMMDGYNIAAKILDDFIAKILTENNLQYNDLVILGFSQGAMMAMQYLSRCKYTLKGVIALSGFILDDGSFNMVNNQQNLLICHGNADAIVPITSYQYAYDKFISLGASVSGHIISGLGHGIDDRMMACIKDFFKKIKSIAIL